MKKWICFALAAVLAVAGCGCAMTAASSAAAESAASSQPDMVASAASSTASSAASSTASSAAPTAEANAELTAILQKISDKYEPGTAGSSLKAAALAGELLDWQAKAAPSADTVKATVSAFTGKMDADAKSVFSEKMEDVLYTAKELLTSENAQELMEEAGFTAEGFPWDAEAGRSFTDAMDADVKE